MTPRVRLDVMDGFDVDYQLRRAEDNFPLKRTEYRRYYLDAAHMDMHDQPVEVHHSVSYDGNEGVVEFDMEFTEDTELTGYMFLRLFVEVDGHDDADMFINIQKSDAAGNWVPWDTLGEHHPGAWGKCRVSHRELDPKLSTSYQPVMAHVREQKLTPGEIAQCDIEIVPSSRFWHKGQRIRVQIAGHYIREGWFEPLTWDTDNHGKHIIHTGGEYASFLQVPYIPPRYKTVGWDYR